MKTGRRLSLVTLVFFSLSPSFVWWWWQALERSFLSTSSDTQRWFEPHPISVTKKRTLQILSSKYVKNYIPASSLWAIVMTKSVDLFHRPMVQIKYITTISIFRPKLCQPNELVATYLIVFWWKSFWRCLSMKAQTCCDSKIDILILSCQLNFTRKILRKNWKF